ncbi:eIF-2-alpha kinase GCN2-like [Paramuricea clavata]|uniref:EIF-2-alpha kinase GCN2-like n=1 Tax=Paramuricea clavata TaxID=317549 RepID=A0A6S7LKR2_PARCT|nr:eIF-2-alpha kinase GCN2-like [Paramuricea clavata]
MAQETNFPLEKIKRDLESRGFQYETIVGEGSDARVVKAKKLSENSGENKEDVYAIKILPLKNDEKAKYLQREVGAVQDNKDSTHQNIVKYYQYWNTIRIDEIQYLCIQMELCRANLFVFVYENEMGGAEIIKAQGPPRFYQHVFPQILEGLRFIHEKISWVHRDLHLKNILIANPNPREISGIIVKIADFGRARGIINTSQSLTDFSKLEDLSPHVGCELFRAPELDTQDYDYKVDLYSAGIVLYFLSRYLEDKKQWKNEIEAFRGGKRRSEDLCHQDDKHLVSLIQLLTKEREKRPTAEKALEIAGKFATSHELVESQTLVEPKKKRFFIKKVGDGTSKRCTMEDDFPQNLSSLKARIGRETDIEANSQILCQQTTIVGAERIEITSDKHVHDMFHSADKRGKDVVIIVSDSKSKAKDFFVEKQGEKLKRCTTADDTLSGLQAGIENLLNVKAESQVLRQKTTVNDKSEHIDITSDQQVESMFASAEKTGKKVVINVSENTSAQNELSTDTSHCESKNFLIKIDNEPLKRGLIKDDTLNLSSLKDEIKKCTGIGAESQVLYQETVKHGKYVLIEIGSDEHVEIMFQSDEDIVIVVSQPRVASLDTMNV